MSIRQTVVATRSGISLVRFTSGRYGYRDNITGELERAPGPLPDESPEEHAERVMADFPTSFNRRQRR